MLGSSEALGAWGSQKNCKIKLRTTMRFLLNAMFCGYYKGVNKRSTFVSRVLVISSWDLYGIYDKVLKRI